LPYFTRTSPKSRIPYLSTILFNTEEMQADSNTTGHPNTYSDIMDSTIENIMDTTLEIPEEEENDIDLLDADQEPRIFTPPPRIAARFYKPTHTQRRKTSAA